MKSPSFPFFVIIILSLVMALTLGCISPSSDTTPDQNNAVIPPSSNQTTIIGFWKAVAVYHWNTENQWIPDLQATDVYSLFLPGESNCPQDGKTYQWLADQGSIGFRC